MTRSSKWLRLMISFSLLLGVWMNAIGAITAAAAAVTHAIPGTIESEAFSFASGIEIENSASAGGGKYVHAADDGQWADFAYVEASAAGLYEAAFKVASRQNGSALRVENAWGEALAVVQIPNTGGLDSWQTVTADIALPSGSQSLHVVAEGGGFHLDNISFALDQPLDETVPMPADALSIALCGATAGDETDDTEGIRACIEAARQSGQQVYVPEGEYHYSACLKLDGVSLLGSGSILNSVNAAAELAVPYTALVPEIGKTIGFNASANDDVNGDGKRDQYISWVDKNLPYWADTKVYNNVQLVAGPAVEPPKATAAPGAPVLSHNNGHDHGLLDGSYTVTMNMWYGNNGTVYKLYENDVLIDTQTLTDDSPNRQTAATLVQGKHNGTYRYRAELTNPFGTTASRELTVTVSHAGPGTPVLSHNNWDGDGSFGVAMNMWWGTSGTTFNLYENGVLIHTEQLEARTPQAQAATVQLTGRAKGSYQYRGEVVNAAGSASSAIMTVKVTK